MLRTAGNAGDQLFLGSHLKEGLTLSRIEPAVVFGLEVVGEAFERPAFDRLLEPFCRSGLVLSR